MYEKYITSISRRDFVKGVAGTAAVAAVGIDALASQAVSDSKVFTIDKPVGDKYSQYLFTGLKDELSAMIPAFGEPAPYFRGAWPSWKKIACVCVRRRSSDRRLQPSFHFLIASSLAKRS